MAEMKNLRISFLVNLGLIAAACVVAFTGFAIQVGYHMGHQGSIDDSRVVIGMTYSDWSAAHKLAVIVLSILVIVHIVRHWTRYKTMVRKKLYGRNKTTVALTLLFVAVAVTGYIPWLIDLVGGHAAARKVFIEIHDKITLILCLYFVIHTAQKVRWFVVSYKTLSGPYSDSCTVAK
jgi:hypothetical protein